MKGIFKQGKAILVALLTILFVMWIYLTDIDPITWHFLPIAYPLIMIFVALGLQKMGGLHYKVVAIGACVLILVNGVFLNANILAKENPLASRYEQELRNLPDGSYVICNSGGNYGLENYYIMSSGKDIRPLFFNGDIPDINEFDSEWQLNYQEFLTNFLINNQHMKPKLATQQVTDMIKQKSATMISPRYEGYLEWMKSTYGLQGDNTIQQVNWLLAQGDTNIYLLTPTVTPYWNGIFKTEPYNIDLSRVLGVNETVK
jgi:hypothetical protein